MPDCFVRRVRQRADARGLRAGLAASGRRRATLLVIPDAGALPDAASHATLAGEMLAACRAGADRMALLDLWGADAAPEPALGAFRAGLAGTPPQARGYGAAYHPPLQVDGVDHALPASAAMAGVIAALDRNHGVWKAPANVPLIGTPTVALDQAAFDRLTHPSDGLAVNAIRAMPGAGTLVWGARTLDANSDNWRCLHVRRTVSWIGQSIRAGLTARVFEPNVAAI